MVVHPIKELNIYRGLKQGDPLAPFLFLLVVEAMTSLSQKAVSIGYFRGFKVNFEISVSLLS
jgi:mannose/fructose/N-acetylgalactosamine-specific phosphotransferase system component IID